MSENPLINIGDLAKPIDTLIQKTSEFVGEALAPRQLIRMAKAKVKADQIEKLGKLETEYQERALKRLLAEEVRNQKNIESIVGQALPNVKEDAKPEEIEDDWLAAFFDKCKRFSDTEMQSLWSKILAGEANRQGTFSKRTIEIVSVLDKIDAMLFTNLCSFLWNIKSNRLLIYDIEDTIYKSKSITFTGLNHLSSLGLITNDFDKGYQQVGLARYQLVQYFDDRFNITFNKFADNYIPTGQAMLTQSGSQLAKVCVTEKYDEFVIYVLDKWRGLGFHVDRLPKEVNPTNVSPDY